MTAARQSMEDSTIKMLGRWWSSAYQLYVRTPQEAAGCILEGTGGRERRTFADGEPKADRGQRPRGQCTIAGIYHVWSKRTC